MTYETIDRQLQLSELELKALNEVRNMLQKKYELALQRRQKDEKFYLARERAAKEFKQQSFTNLLQKMGINQEELTVRQSRDRETVKQYILDQKKLAMGTAHQTNMLQQESQIEYLARLKKISLRDMRATATIITILDRAALIQIAGDGTTSINPNQNLVFTKAFIESGGYLGGPLRGNIVNADWYFVYTPPRDGFLNVTSFLAMNGASTLFTNTTCDGGSASASVTGTILLNQGNAKDSSVTSIFASDIVSSWGNSLGSYQFIALDETDTVGYRPTQFPVVADIPVVITVAASLYVLVQNGEAELDFMSGDFRLNVPYVFLSLT